MASRPALLCEKKYFRKKENDTHQKPIYIKEGHWKRYQ